MAINNRRDGNHLCIGDRIGPLGQGGADPQTSAVL